MTLLKTDRCLYKAFLSCHDRADTKNILKYNLHTERVEAQLSLRGYPPRKITYGWGGFSGVDLAVDEQGLWVLFGSYENSDRLVASKIDTKRNTINQTWNLSTGKYKFSKTN